VAPEAWHAGELAGGVNHVHGRLAVLAPWDTVPLSLRQALGPIGLAGEILKLVHPVAEYCVDHAEWQSFHALVADPLARGLPVDGHDLFGIFTVAVWRGRVVVAAAHWAEFVTPLEDCSGHARVSGLRRVLVPGLSRRRELHQRFFIGDISVVQPRCRRDGMRFAEGGWGDDHGVFAVMDGLHEPVVEAVAGRGGRRPVEAAFAGRPPPLLWIESSQSGERECANWLGIRRRPVAVRVFLDATKRGVAVRGIRARTPFLRGRFIHQPLHAALLIAEPPPEPPSQFVLGLRAVVGVPRRIVVTVPEVAEGVVRIERQFQPLTYIHIVRQPRRWRT